MSNSLWPLGLQHTRTSCSSPTPRAYSNSCPLSRWCHPTISSSVAPFSCPQSSPASGSFPMSDKTIKMIILYNRIKHVLKSRIRTCVLGTEKKEPLIFIKRAGKMSLEHNLRKQNSTVFHQLLKMFSDQNISWFSVRFLSIHLLGNCKSRWCFLQTSPIV